MKLLIVAIAVLIGQFAFAVPSEKLTCSYLCMSGRKAGPSCWIGNRDNKISLNTYYGHYKYDWSLGKAISTLSNAGLCDDQTKFQEPTCFIKNLGPQYHPQTGRTENDYEIVTTESGAATSTTGVLSEMIEIMAKFELRDPSNICVITN